jgi:hypothetical protein
MNRLKVPLSAILRYIGRAVSLISVCRPELIVTDAALPSDVRKVSDLPGRPKKLGAMPLSSTEFDQYLQSVVHLQQRISAKSSRSTNGSRSISLIARNARN